MHKLLAIFSFKKGTGMQKKYAKKSFFIAALITLLTTLSMASSSISFNDFERMLTNLNNTQSGSAYFDPSESKCVMVPKYECPNGENLVSGIDDTCNGARFSCPDGYQISVSAATGRPICVKDPSDCPFNPAYGVCVKNPITPCSQMQVHGHRGTFVWKSGIFDFSNALCKIDECIDSISDGTKCVTNGTGYECPILLDGWYDVPQECPAGYVKKWESDNEPLASRRGWKCVPQNKIKRYVKQDYETDPVIHSSLPHYFHWIKRGSSCSKKVKVLRCPKDTGAHIEFKEVVKNDGHYYGEKGKTGPKKDFACYADIEYTYNYWQEKMSTSESELGGRSNCPSGFTRIGNKCFTNGSCPSGSVENNGQCIVYSSPSRTRVSNCTPNAHTHCIEKTESADGWSNVNMKVSCSGILFAYQFPIATCKVLSSGKTVTYDLIGSSYYPLPMFSISTIERDFKVSIPPNVANDINSMANNARYAAFSYRYDGYSKTKTYTVQKRSSTTRRYYIQLQCNDGEIVRSGAFGMVTRCKKTVPKTCPSGTTYDAASDKCFMSVSSSSSSHSGNGASSDISKYADYLQCESISDPTYKILKKRDANGNLVYDKTKYVPGKFRCYMRPIYSYGMSGVAHYRSLGTVRLNTSRNSCEGTWGPAGEVVEQEGARGSKLDEGTWQYRSEIKYANCETPIYVHDSFTWEEKCPPGYEFNDKVRVTPVPATDGKNRLRQPVSGSTNPKRCYKKPTIHVDKIDLDNGLYLIKDFIEATEYWTVPAKAVCSQPGFTSEGSRCVRPLPKCRNGEKMIGGFCYKPLTGNDISCPSGYSFDGALGKCTKKMTCDNPLDSPNPTIGKCVREIDANNCLHYHTEGFPFMCEKRDICPDGEESVKLELNPRDCFKNVNLEDKHQIAGICGVPKGATENDLNFDPSTGQCTYKIDKTNVQCADFFGYAPETIDGQQKCVKPFRELNKDENCPTVKQSHTFTVGFEGVNSGAGKTIVIDGAQSLVVIADTDFTGGMLKIKTKSGQTFEIPHKTRKWKKIVSGDRVTIQALNDQPGKGKAVVKVFDKSIYDTIRIQGGNVDRCIADAIPSCPEGFSRGGVDGNANQCQKEVDSASACPAGYLYDAQRNLCVKREFAPGIVKGSSSWWYCDSCADDYETIKNFVTKALKGAGATYVNVDFWVHDSKCNINAIKVTHDSKEPLVASINSTDYSLLIRPGETLLIFYKGFMRGNDCKSISGGGKPWMYLRFQGECKNKVYVPGTKDYPPHYACKDTITTCPSGYTNTTDKNGKNVCVKETTTEPICLEGSFGDAGTSKDKCYQPISYTFPAFESWELSSDGRHVVANIECPMGLEGGIYDPGSDRCIDNKDFSFKCDGSKGYKKLSETSTQKVCEKYAECPGDGLYCKGKVKHVCPDGYLPDPLDPNYCVAKGKCPPGYVEDKEDPDRCVMRYNWSLYSCDGGFEGPIEKGADCNGKCGSDGCWCNSKNPPANNCRKKADDPNEGYVVEKKRPMQYHFIWGDPLVPNEFGKIKKKMVCTKGCLYYVDKITTDKDKICFYKTNGKHQCYKVDKCYFQGSIVSRPGRHITGLELPDSHTLKPLNDGVHGEIVSSCRMNGHMGFEGYDGGIVSIDIGKPVTRYAIIKTDKGTYKIDDNTHWQGFNIGTMAVHLSDGNWYVAKSMRDTAGHEVDRDLPSFIKYIDNSLYYPVDYNQSEQIDCMYKGKKLEKQTCLKAVKIVMPKPDLSVIGVRDIESLKRLQPEKYRKVDVNIKIQFQKGPALRVRGLKVPEIKLQKDKVNFNSAKPLGVTDKLLFWNSFNDGFVGFLEFVRETKDQDRLDGFVPEKNLPYILASKGFTSIYYDENKMVTYAINPTNKNAEFCDGEYKAEFAPLMETTKGKIRYLGGSADRGCILLINGTVGGADFAHQYYSVKKEYYTGNYQFKCSPFNCVGHQCFIATCPDGFYGDLVPEYLKKNGACTEQKCDGTKDYVQMCGKKVDCRKKNKDLVYKDGRCYEYVCREGIFHPEDKTCWIKKCPPGTHENGDGTCSF